MLQKEDQAPFYLHPTQAAEIQEVLDVSSLNIAPSRAHKRMGSFCVPWHHPPSTSFMARSAVSFFEIFFFFSALLSGKCTGKI
mmetsp:Transcript_31491/g.53752  ORF Transcript_31491/g.53752 Transcript_31491/m.53752 type:complete len:83 (+) Transcript_31491:581-829(+)